MKKKLLLITLLIGIWGIFTTNINTSTLHSASVEPITKQSEQDYPNP
ncbi:hypothetical protein P9853_00250 [Geobacillus stearothermophilus]|nr:hypothetical protein [Geobacillus stearothermophilus]MED4880746.1 hypothetical protein [Geobacillus stearothermophilus]MED5010671.1 hypothetical protein [Geobacillus stearothermophilus]MED5014716.1 hypothetical protein [Geobacillus stearothermophilus]MED5043531.1 hypothetical protein [Geobacillus stearothermophilus]WJM14244.1 hypothetical protein QSJ10_15365 [Geobacillus stearothermophilus ATCC 12980]